MLILCIVLAGVTALSLTSLFILGVDIKKINEQIIYKNENNSHFDISIQSHMPIMKNLQSEINNLYEKIYEVEEQAFKKENEMKTLISGISHDIRTPLTSMKGYLQFIQDSSNETERKKYEDIVMYRLETLEGMLEDLFLYSKMNDNDYEMKKESINLYALVCKVMAAYYYDFDKHHIIPVILFANEQLCIMANYDMTVRLIQNLINNALKYGNDYFEISEKNGTVCFINNVISSDQIDIDHLFDRFYQGDEMHKKNSAGLGLSIVKQIADIHGWYLHAQIKNDRLCIILQLPNSGKMV